MMIRSCLTKSLVRNIRWKEGDGVYKSNNYWRRPAPSTKGRTDTRHAPRGSARHSAAVTHAGGGARCRAGSSGGGGRPRVTGVALAAERSRRGHPQPRHGSALLASRPGPGLPDQYRLRAASRRPPARRADLLLFDNFKTNRPADWVTDYPPHHHRSDSALRRQSPLGTICVRKIFWSRTHPPPYLNHPLTNEQTRIYGVTACNFHNYLSDLSHHRRNLLPVVLDVFFPAFLCGNCYSHKYSTIGRGRLNIFPILSHLFTFAPWLLWLFLVLSTATVNVYPVVKTPRLLVDIGKFKLKGLPNSTLCYVSSHFFLASPLDL